MLELSDQVDGWKMMMGTIRNFVDRVLEQFKQLRERGLKLRKKSALWWLKKSDHEQRAFFQQGAAISACAVVMSVLLPNIEANYVEKRADARTFLAAQAITSTDSALAALAETKPVANLLEHSWLRTVEYSIERAPTAALTRTASYERDFAALQTTIEDRAGSFDKAEGLASEYKCLTQAVYYEAGFEPTAGKLAVAEVIMNRVADHRYPNSVCEVVFQGATRSTGCQFTFTCDGALGRKPDAEKWKAAEAVASHVLMNLHETRTGSATHYHANYVDPVWNAGLMRTTKIGAHIFYRFPRGSEWANIQEAVDRKRATLALRRQVIASRERVAKANAEALEAGYTTVRPGDTLKAIRTVSTSETDRLNAAQLTSAAVAPAP